MNQIMSSRVALLLADPSACLRLLVLREMLGYPDDDPEVQELLELRERDPLVRDLLERQADDGSWEADGRLWQGGRQRATYLALMRLGYVGFDATHQDAPHRDAPHPAVQRGAEYLFSLQQDDGSWSFTSDGTEGGEREGYAMVPLQTALPLRALAMCGYGSDPRAERAYTWLLSKRLDDGAWPTGIAGGPVADGVYGYVAGYRRLAHSRWGCRSNTTGSLLCLAHHPERRSSPGLAARSTCSWDAKRARRSTWAWKWRGWWARNPRAASSPSSPASIWRCCSICAGGSAQRPTTRAWPIWWVS